MAGLRTLKKLKEIIKLELENMAVLSSSIESIKSGTTPAKKHQVLLEMYIWVDGYQYIEITKFIRKVNLPQLE